LVSSEDHILAGTSILEVDEHKRDQLLARVKNELILAGGNLRSWLSDESSRQGLVDLVQKRPVRVTLILATYETLGPLGGEGAKHLQQSAEDIDKMLNQLAEKQRPRMRAFFHKGAATLSAVFVDPESQAGILFLTPRWATQYQPQTRLTCMIDKTKNSPALYNAVYHSVLLMTQADALTVKDMLQARNTR
jgi:hypothetical protein